MLISFAGREDADDLFAIFSLYVSMDDDQEKPAADHSQRVPALFPLFVDPSSMSIILRVFDHAGGSLEIEPVLPPVGPILGRVPFKPPHARYTYRITLCRAFSMETAHSSGCVLRTPRAVAVAAPR